MLGTLVNDQLFTTEDSDDDLPVVKSKTHKASKLFDSDDECDDLSREKDKGVLQSETDSDTDEESVKFQKKCRKRMLLDESDNESHAEKEDKNHYDSETDYSDEGENPADNPEPDIAQYDHLTHEEYPEEITHKKEKKSISRKEKEKAKEKIHSETQRIIRESRSQIPYYQPKPKTLSEVLARTKEKQSLIKGKSTRLVINKKCDPMSIINKTVDLTTVNDENKMACQGLVSDDKSSTSIVETANQELNSDLLELKSPVNPDEIQGFAEIEMPPESCALRDGQCMDSEIQESETLEKPVKKNDTDASDGLKDHVEFKDETKNKNSSENTQTLNLQLELESVSPKEKRSLIHIDDKIKALTPKLSGGEKEIVDLDNDDDTPTVPKQTGVEKLMDRLRKHSLKKKKKGSKAVEINVVQKKKTEVNDKEELKLEKVTVVVDGDNDDDDDNSQSHMAPGARWGKVKQKLQAELKVKREEARKRNREIYNLENEEGYDEERLAEEQELEAELTDQTDTDGDSEEEAGGQVMDWDEEEEDEDYIPGVDDNLSSPKGMKSEFVNEEASEDEKEWDSASESELGEIEEADLKLNLDADSDDEEAVSGDKTTNSETGTCDSEESSVQPPPPRIPKLNPVVLDEDAISDSPLSQPDKKNTRVETNAVIDRPFQQLSQGNSKIVQEDNSESTGVEVVCESSLLSADSSFDLIPAGQRSASKNGRLDRSTADLFSNCSKTSENTASSCMSRRLGDLTLPIEDSQLFVSSKPAETLYTDTESRWLDDDGFLKPVKKQSSMLGEADPSTQENMDELLGLCSGKFTENSSRSVSNTVGSFGFSSQLASTQNNMDELLGLCSGKFSEGTPRTQLSNKNELLQIGELVSTQGPTDTQTNMDELLGLCSGTFRTSSPALETDVASTPKPRNQKKQKRIAVINSDDEDDDIMVMEGSNAGNVVDRVLGATESLDDDVEGSSCDINQENEPVDSDTDDEDKNMKNTITPSFKGFKAKSGKIRSEFLEAEAELSGSECDSDENLDLDEKDDIMEEELGDKDDLGLTEEELRNQVGRAHLKGMIDEDKRELRLYQEMFLADGDLHSEGQGRQRRFKWKDVDDDTQGDLFDGDSEDEKQEDTNEADLKWRLERYEREKFLKEQNNANQSEDKSSSQFKKLGMKFMKRQQSVTRNKPATEKTTIGRKAGSLLVRQKDTLNRIAQLAKPINNPNGTRHSHNFVFSTLSPGAEAKPKIERSTSKTEPPKKRLKVERSISVPEKSIFRLI